MSNNGKKIVDAKENSEGDITAVKLKGNATFTPIKTAIKMTKLGQIDAVPVKATPNAKEHIRTRPDKKESNNLDTMAKKKKK